MKKLMLIMLLAALTCAATAQTNFRDLSYAEALQAAKAENKILSFGRRAESAHKLLEALFSKPIVSIKGVQTITNLSPKAAGELVNLFVDNGLLQEVSNQQRNRAFAFTEYLDLFIK